MLFSEHATEIKEAIFSNMIGQPVKLYHPEDTTFHCQYKIETLGQFLNTSFLNQVPAQELPFPYQNPVSAATSIEGRINKLRFLVKYDGVTHKIDFLNNIAYVNNSYGVAHLKEDIAKSIGVPTNKLTFYFNGKILPDENKYPLTFYGIKEGDYIEVCFKLVGGQAIGINMDLFDTQWDFDFTPLNDGGAKFYRGNEEYIRPLGWYRYGIRVLVLFC